MAGIGIMSRGLGEGVMPSAGQAHQFAEVLSGGGGLKIAEGLGRVGGGGGEAEIGLEIDGGFDGLEGVSEGGLAEPAAEDGGSGPIVGSGAGGAFSEGAQKFRLGAGRSGNVGHKFLLWNELVK